MATYKEKKVSATTIDEEFDEWIDCWNCDGEGYSSHDCGEDTCCCLIPEDNVQCDVCRGKGGWIDTSEQPHS